MTDPLEVLTGPDRPVDPDPAFARRLRGQLAALLSTPDLEPIPRRNPMTTARAVPYLTVSDGAAALDFYRDALGATEVMRVEMDDGTLGHAEIRIGGASVYLSDEFPAMGVVSPTTLGGTSVAVHLTVDAVDDRFARAVAAGATALAEPADQPHGARHGTLVDPFGHRWLLSQPLTPEPTGPAAGGIWAALNYADALAGIRFVVDVLGFEEQLVVPGADPAVVEHSQLRWPEGGIVQAASAGRSHGGPFADRPTGTESLYVITADPMAVHDRCVAAGVEVVMPPEAPDYDPDGLVFTIRDPEGNLWSFGTYAGEG